MTHTPGPWRAEQGEWGSHSEDAHENGFTIMMGKNQMDSGSIHSAHMIRYGENSYPEDTEYEEIKANANLIAAAPELLEAAEDYLLLMVPADMSQPELTRLRQAIAKAKGE